MNDYSSRALLLLAALQQYEAIPQDWKHGILQGMFWLTDQLITSTEGHPEHDHEHRYVQAIQQYIEQAFKHPQHQISDMAVELCSRILPGIPDDDSPNQPIA